MKWKRSLAAFLLALLLLLPACSNRGLPEDPPSDAAKSSESVDLKEWRSEKQAEAAGDDAEPAVLASEADTDDDESETVYVTETGAKYHRSGCQYLRKSKIPISLNEAKKSYDPCSKCKPPK